MSDDKIAEIRERYAGYSLNSGNAGKANDDRGWLLAEVERMHGLLKDISRDMAEEIESLTRARDEARAEVERLRAAATSAGAALAAAIELLERGRRAAPSKRMFSQMLSDYRATVARTRKALEDGR